jgi:hypothetical protein
MPGEKHLPVSHFSSYPDVQTRYRTHFSSTMTPCGSIWPQIFFEVVCEVAGCLVRSTSLSVISPDFLTFKLATESVSHLLRRLVVRFGCRFLFEAVCGVAGCQVRSTSLSVISPDFLTFKPATESVSYLLRRLVVQQCVFFGGL